MATTAVPAGSLEDALREETDLAEIGREFSDGVQELVAESRTEARAAGRQYWLLHRLWQLQEEAREQRWAVEAHWLPVETDRLGPHSLEPEEQTLRDVADEIGPAFRLPAGTALRRVEDAVLLGESLPEVLDALEQGLLGARQASVLVELWRDLVWDAATAHAIQDRLDALADRTDPAAPAPFSGQAVLNRTVPAHSVPGGAVPVPALSAYGTSGAVAPASRTVPQLRADVLADLLLDGEPADLPDHLRGIRGHVTVTVPALALLRNTGEVQAGAVEGLPGTSRCAELDGYGPIPVGLAERIAARAPSWSRILTHPVTGTVLDRDRSTYAVPADLKHRLRARDGTCRFPGCRRRASRCDLDHTVAWADGGRTAADNLAHLCRHHHLLKHRDGPLGRWRVEHVELGRPGTGHGTNEPRRAGRTGLLDRHGVLEWTSPAGQVHRTYPQEYLAPAPHRVAPPGPPPGPPPGSRPLPGPGPADDPPPF